MQIPKNVVQTGSVDPLHKVYIEDYVHTYLIQRKKSPDTAGYALFGSDFLQDGIHYYFVYGAIREETGWEVNRRRYFGNYVQIGEAMMDEKGIWFFFQDGFSMALDGFFIFYEQNEDMQSYMIAQHQKEAQAQEQSGKERGTAGEVRPRRQRAAGRAEDTGSRGTSTLKEGAWDKKAEKVAAVDALAPEKRTVEKGEAIEEKTVHAAEFGKGNSLDGEGSHGRQDGEDIRDFQRKDHAGGSYGGENSRARRGREDIRGRGNGSGRGTPENGGKGVGTLVRAACAVFLIVLCVTGLTSVNHYNDMKEAGNMFAQAAQSLEQETGELTQETASAAGEGALGVIFEEHQIGESAAETDTSQTAQTLQAPQETAAVPESPETAASEPAAATPETVVEAFHSESVAETAAPDLEEPKEEEGKAPEETKPAAEVIAIPETYVIQNGDNLAGISRRFYGTTDKIDTICQMNGIEDPNKVTPGQKIVLP